MAKSSSVDVINRWCSLYNRVNNRKSDWPEILSLLWFRRMMDAETEKEKQLGGVTLKPKDYWAILAYTVWVSKCNSDEEADGKVISNVFKEYRRMTDAFNAKKLDRYGLSVGDEFGSAGEMANALGFRNPVISKWIKNGWVAEKP